MNKLLYLLALSVIGLSGPLLGMDAQVVTPTLGDRVVKEVSQAILATAEKTHSFGFSHWLFFGSAGMGKEAVAFNILNKAEKAGFVGVKLDSYVLCDPDVVNKLAKDFESIKSSQKKAIITIDLDAVKDQNILCKLVGRFDPERQNCTIIAYSDYPEKIAPFILRRLGRQIHFKKPDLDERKRLFVQWARKYFIDDLKEDSEITISEEVFSDEVSTQFAQKSDGFVVNDIADIMLKVVSIALQSEKPVITQEIIFNVLEKKKQEMAVMQQLLENLQGDVLI